MPTGYTIDSTNTYTVLTEEGFAAAAVEGFLYPPPTEGSVKVYDGEGWIEVGHLPDQTGNGGKVLSTDGSDPTWVPAFSGINWTLLDDNPLTSLAGLTARSGTWDLTGPGGTLKQTNTATTAYSRMDVDITTGYTGDLAAIEFECYLHGNGNSSFKRAWGHCTWDGTSTGAPVGGIRWGAGDTWRGEVERDAAAAGTNGSVDAKAYNQWIQVRHLNWQGISYIYIDGVLATTWQHDFIPGTVTGRTHIGLYTYGCDVSFRNLRGWTASTVPFTLPW